jgi:hypothetical protein
MEGFGVKYWTNYSHSIEYKDYDSPDNYTLFFFVTTLMIYAIGVG